jgi:hypothetical protein
MDPSQIGLCAVLESAHGVHKDREYPFPLEATGLAYTEDAFDKAVTFFDPRAKAAFAPQYRISQSPFRVM